MLLGIGTAVPEIVGTQEIALAFMEQVMEANRAVEAKSLIPVMRRIYRHSGIERRHTVLTDYACESPDDFTFFPQNWALDPFPGTAERMALYEKFSVQLAARAAREALSSSGIAPVQVTHLVISTCTGFFAPGPDVLLARELGLASHVKRTIIGFMGCYAGLTGLRTAHEIISADPNAVVLQVAVELCSLHYQKENTVDTIVANALFADGAAAAVYGGRGAPGVTGGQPLARVLACRSEVSPDSLGSMSWRIGNHGFLMTLDAAVPDLLRGSAPAFLQTMAAEAGLTPHNVAGWAIHPGGRKILDVLEEVFELQPDQLSASREVLRDYGNMSSATILFVLQRALQRDRQEGAIAALAFGPGLTTEGALLLTS